MLAVARLPAAARQSLDVGTVPRARATACDGGLRSRGPVTFNGLWAHTRRSAARKLPRPPTLAVEVTNSAAGSGKGGRKTAFNWSFVLQACAVPGILPLFARLLAQHGAVLVRTPEGKPPVWTTEKAALVLEKLVAADARVAQLARQFNVTPEHLRQWRSRVMVGESSELVERLMQVAPRLADTAASGVVKPSPTVFIRETRNIMGDQALAAAFQRHDMVLQYSGTRATPAWSTAKAGELLRDLVQHDAKIAQLAAQHNVTPTSLRIWRKNALKGQNADLVAALVQLVPTLRAID